MKICRTCGAQWRGEGSECPLDGGALEDVPDEFIGRTVAGRYAITDCVGAGGMGTVYRGRHTLVGREVALKVLSPDLALDPVYRERFLREARAANRIDHPNVLGITDCGETDDGLVYLVMDFLVGESLGQRLTRGPLPAPRALDIGIQISGALARAHELGVIHRDVKPDNIFLVAGPNDSDIVKLLDFGLATIRDDVRLTASGTVFGTPEYMAPEQTRGAHLSGQADLYALGCVLFEMLVGEPPFAGSPPEVIVKHIRQAPVAPSARVPSVPAELSALVLRLLAKDPEARPAGAAALSSELRAMVAGSSVPAANVAQAPPASDGAGRTARLRELSRAAYPEGAPAWILDLTRAMEADEGELARCRVELEERKAELDRQEQEAREARTQLGGALEVLSRDEARSRRERGQLGAQLDDARTRAAALAPALRSAWASLPARPDELAIEAAEALRNAGQIAGLWIDAERATGALGSELEKRAQESEDLRFQVEHLERRLASLDAETEGAAASLRERAARLEERVREIEERIARAWRELVQHFALFPALADSARALAS